MIRMTETKAIKIRPENLDDRAEVARLLACTYRVDGVKVIESTSKLRDLPKHNPALSLVAEQGGQAAGFVLFTPVDVAGKENDGVIMAPLAVDQKVENFDTSAFLEDAMEAVKNEGYRFVFAFAPSVKDAGEGFDDAKQKGFNPSAGGNGAVFVVKDLTPDAGGSDAGEVECPEPLV